MARKVAEKTPIAWLNEDHPEATDGPGYYVIDEDDPDDHQNASFGKKVEWNKATPDKEGDDGVVINDPENNEGHFVYANNSEEG